MGFDRDDFLAAVDSIVPLRELRWVWLTHDDADHTGSVEAVMELAPQARLMTHVFCALRMATWWPVPLPRVHALVPGQRLDVGDRTLLAVKPPTFDNPMSTGLLDEKTGALFTVDAFGAILPDVVQDAAHIPAEVLVQGISGWATFDSPWTHLLERHQWAQVLGELERLAPSRVLSSHLPPFSGGIDQLLPVLEAVPDAERFVPPDQAIFEQMIAMMQPPEPLPT